MFRVEHCRSGLGPYANSSIDHHEVLCGKHWITGEHDDTCPFDYDYCEDLEDLREKLCVAHEDSSHPSWFSEGWDLGSHYRSGFSSLNKLLRWFDGYLEALEDAGYVVVEYSDDPKAFNSAHQDAFSIQRSERIRELDWNEVLSKQLMSN